MKRNSGVKVEDGPGAVKVSIVYEPSTVTPVIVLMRSESLTYFIEDILMIDYEISDKVKWYHEVNPLVFTRRREGFFSYKRKFY